MEFKHLLAAGLIAPIMLAPGAATARPHTLPVVQAGGNLVQIQAPASEEEERKKRREGRGEQREERREQRQERREGAQEQRQERRQERAQERQERPERQERAQEQRPERQQRQERAQEQQPERQQRQERAQEQRPERQQRQERAQEQRQEQREQTQDQREKLRERAQEQRENTREQAQEQRENTRERAQEQRENTRERAQDQREDTRERLRERAEQQREQRQERAGERREERREERAERREDRRDGRRDERGSVEDFIRGGNNRSGRREVIEDRGGRTVIRDGDRRVIIREDGRVRIRNDETDRFRRGGRKVNVERGRDGNNVATIVGPGGVTIITVTDNNGRLLRRVRRGRDGREVILIDNTRPPREPSVIVNLPPLRLDIPRERYIVDAGEADYEMIEEVFDAPPVEAVERPYTLDEVRQNYRVRQKVRSIDLDTITFAFGSWEVPESQIDQLDEIARGLKEAVDADPNLIVMVEGHTDAVGSDLDNLALSDRRAEEVAVILTEYYDIPPENLVTQGYGEEFLKIDTESAEEQNRRVTLRNITPLMSQAR